MFFIFTSCFELVSNTTCIVCTCAFVYMMVIDMGCYDVILQLAKIYFELKDYDTAVYHFSEVKEASNRELYLYTHLFCFLAAWSDNLTFHTTWSSLMNYQHFNFMAYFILSYCLHIIDWLCLGAGAVAAGLGLLLERAHGVVHQADQIHLRELQLPGDGRWGRSAVLHTCQPSRCSGAI